MEMISGSILVVSGIITEGDAQHRVEGLCSERLCKKNVAHVVCGVSFI